MLGGSREDTEGKLSQVPIFIRFLHCWTSIPLEDLCDKRHFCAARVPELDPDQCIGMHGSLLISVAGARGSTEMSDIVMLAIGLGFFALSVACTMACGQL
jgi:hypothetical protein